MPNPVKPVPQGYHTTTPYLTVSNAARAIEFYTKALGAREIMRMEGPGGKIGHAELKIGDSIIMLADEMPQGATKSPQTLGGTTGGIFLYVENVDAFYDKAISGGGKATMRPENMFWGDRFGQFTDPFGHSWSVATHIEDVTPQEMEKRSREAMQKMAQQQRPQHA
jgi:PhnB protein